MPTLAALAWFLILYPPKGYGQFEMLDPTEGVVYRTISKENCELRLKVTRERMRDIQQRHGQTDGYALCVSAEAPPVP